MNRKTRHNSFLVRLALLCVFSSLLLSVFTSLIGTHYYEKKQREQARLVLDLKHEMIEEILYKEELTVKLLADSMKSGMDIEKFEKAANRILQEKGYLYVYLVNEDEVETALPKSVLAADKGKPLNKYPYAFNIAHVLKRTVIEGPIEMKGQQCFLFSAPILNNDTCLGQVLVAMDVTYITERINLEYLYEQGYDYEFWQLDIENGRKNVVQSSNAQVDLSDAESIVFHLPTEWTLLIRPVGGWVPTAQGAVIFGKSMLGWGLFATCIFLFILLLIYKKRKSEADCIDAETGIENVIGFLKTLMHQIQKGKSEYTIFFFTMDEYIALSRKMGAEVRKSYLSHIVYKLENYIYNDHIIGRVGESSYIVAVFEKLSTKQATDLARGLSLDLLWKTEIDNEKVYIHTDWKFICCPQDGTEPAALIESVIRS